MSQNEFKRGDKFIIELDTPTLCINNNKMYYNIKHVPGKSFTAVELAAIKKAQASSPSKFTEGFKAGTRGAWNVAIEVFKLTPSERIDLFGTSEIDEIRHIDVHTLSKKLSRYKGKIEIGDEIIVVTNQYVEQEPKGIYLGEDDNWLYLQMEGANTPKIFNRAEIIATARTGRKAVLTQLSKESKSI